MKDRPTSTDLPTLVVIAGPTAVGKTQCAIEVAEYLETEIISADSRQIYKELNIGVARPSEQELARVRHHFIAEKSIHENYTAADFEKEALSRIYEIFETKNHVVLSGGTGLYVTAVLEGFDDIPPSDKVIEARWQDTLDNEGITRLQTTLKDLDPLYYKRVDLMNSRRLIRALSVIEATGRPFSSFQKGTSKDRPFEKLVIKLDLPRDELYNRINSRVDDMVTRGLVEEAKKLLPHFDLRALKTVGYQELEPFFKDQCTLEDAINKVKQRSRNYAKRQLTWLNNSLDGIVLHPENVLEYISKRIR